MPCFPRESTRIAARWLPLAAALVTTGVARAQLTVDAASSQFAAHALGVWSYDPVNDQQASIRSVDIVGEGSLSAFQVSDSSDTLFFRLRLNVPSPSTGIQNPGYFNQVAAVGIDLDGNGIADIAFAVSGKNGPGIDAGQSYFMSFGESLAATPNTTDWGHPYGAQNWTTNGAGADFNYSLVSSIDGAVGEVPGSIGPNAFLTFAVSYTRLQDAVRALGAQYTGFVVDASAVAGFNFSGHTGTQTNSVNVDVINDGHVIPEFRAAWFLALGVLPLVWWRHRRGAGTRRSARVESASS